MKSAYDAAFDLVLKHEGGYVWDADDPGGETKYGISKRAYPHLSIPDITEEVAKNIYKKDYWDKIRGDQLPIPIAIMVFDFAINSGVHRASKTLQETVGAIPDGRIGNKTLDSVYGLNVKEILVEYSSRRMEFYKSLPTYKKFGKGWLRRTNETLKFCQNIV